MKSHTFLLANLISTGVISLVMYDLAHPPLCNYIRSNILTSLRIYYKHKSLIELVLYAVIHKIVIVSFAMLITTFVFSFRTPSTSLQFILFLAVALPFSFLYCHLLKYLKLISKDLEPYHKQIDVGVACSMNTLVCGCSSYIGVKYILPFM